MKMKFLVLLLFFQVFGFSQIINIPDTNFKNKLLQASASNNIAGGNIIDTNANGQIEVSEAQLVTYLNVIISNISDLTGIEYFINLQQLLIQYNSISTINISTLTNLVRLRCDFNNLTGLNFNDLTNLQELTCNNNQISNLSFDGLNNLNSVTCNNNQISTLDFSQNPLLKKLICSNNNLTSINLKNGINHDFSNVNFNDCWKTGNPNLAAICVDTSELASVQNHLNNCGTAQTISITSNCGLGGEEFAANKVVLYPNPTNNFVTLHNEGGFFTTVVIYNYLGQELKRLSVIDEIVEINLINFNSGIYFFNLLGEKNEIVKIVKQ